MGRGMIHLVSGVWVFRTGAHQGKTLEEVAAENPNYLQWMRKKATENLSDEAFYALEDVMLKNGIEVKA